MAQALCPRGEAWVALGDPRQRAGAALGREAGPLGVDQHSLVRLQAPGQRVHPLQLHRLARAAADEVVRQAPAGDVEAGVGEQLALEHEAQPDPMRTGDEDRGQEVVDDARVADQDDHRPRRDLLLAGHLEAEAEQRPDRPEEDADP